MPSPFRLVMRSGPRTGQVIPLEAEEISIGRETTNQVVIEDPEVSRTHARIYAQGRSYFIEDRGSTNGTSVNGQRIVAPYMLQNGDLITLGENTHMVFEGTSLDQAATIASVPAGMPSQPQPQPQPRPEAGRPVPPPVQPVQQVPPQPARTNYAPPPPAYTPPMDPFPQQVGYGAQVFDNPAEPVAPRRKLSTLVIVLLILVGCLLFACIVFAVIDTLNLYCVLLPGIVNTFVPGYCP